MATGAGAEPYAFVLPVDPVYPESVWWEVEAGGALPTCHVLHRPFGQQSSAVSLLRKPLEVADVPLVLLDWPVERNVQVGRFGKLRDDVVDRDLRVLPQHIVDG